MNRQIMCAKQDTTSSDPTSQPRRPSSRSKSLGKGLLIGVILGAVTSVVVLVVMNRDSTPRITSDDLSAAHQRWEKNGPANYDLTVDLSGDQSGNYEVSVRDGKVARVARNGLVEEDKTRRHWWNTWTVPGLFEMIEREFENAENPHAYFGAPQGSKAIIKCQFDSEIGYPSEYERFITGTDRQIHWEITRFEIVESDTPLAPFFSDQ